MPNCRVGCLSIYLFNCVYLSGWLSGDLCLYLMCLSVWLAVCQSVYLSICVYLSGWLSVFLSVYLCLFFGLDVCRSVHICFYLSICLSDVSVCRSLCLFVYLCLFVKVGCLLICLLICLVGWLCEPVFPCEWKGIHIFQ